mgnify:CR=1 FL=1
MIVQQYLYKNNTIYEKGPEGGDHFLGYIMQFRADPVYYALAYGVKARDVVDLFSTYHRQLDYISTVKSILQVMSEDPTRQTAARLCSQSSAFARLGGQDHPRCSEYADHPGERRQGETRPGRGFE